MNSKTITPEIVKTLGKFFDGKIISDEDYKKLAIDFPETDLPDPDFPDDK